MGIFHWLLHNQPPTDGGGWGGKDSASHHPVKPKGKGAILPPSSTPWISPHVDCLHGLEMWPSKQGWVKLLFHWPLMPQAAWENNWMVLVSYRSIRVNCALTALTPQTTDLKLTWQSRREDQLALADWEDAHCSIERMSTGRLRGWALADWEDAWAVAVWEHEHCPTERMSTGRFTVQPVKTLVGHSTPFSLLISNRCLTGENWITIN